MHALALVTVQLEPVRTLLCNSLNPQSLKHLRLSIKLTLLGFIYWPYSAGPVSSKVVTIRDPQSLAGHMNICTDWYRLKLPACHSQQPLGKARPACGRWHICRDWCGDTQPALGGSTTHAQHDKTASELRANTQARACSSPLLLTVSVT